MIVETQRCTELQRKSTRTLDSQRLCGFLNAPCYVCACASRRVIRRCRPRNWPSGRWRKQKVLAVFGNFLAIRALLHTRVGTYGTVALQIAKRGKGILQNGLALFSYHRVSKKACQDFVVLSIFFVSRFTLSPVPARSPQPRATPGTHTQYCGTTHDGCYNLLRVVRPLGETSDVVLA